MVPDEHGSHCNKMAVAWPIAESKCWKTRVHLASVLGILAFPRPCSKSIGLKLLAILAFLHIFSKAEFSRSSNILTPMLLQTSVFISCMVNTNRPCPPSLRQYLDMAPAGLKTYYITEDDLELLILQSPHPEMLRLQVCTTMPDYGTHSTN